jgi:phage antirepressor YoqD-like protein
MNELDLGLTSPVMTVRQVAESLGYESETIRKKVKELFPEAVSPGLLTYLSEEMVYKIKQALVPRTLALKSGVESASTEIEMKEKALEVMTWLYSERSRLTARLAIVEPKAAYADDISNTDGGIPLADFAKVLAGKGWQIGRTRLYRLLVASKILFDKYLPVLKRNVAQPYQSEIEAGRFLLHMVTINPMNAIYPQTLITPKGQRYVIDHLVEWEVARLEKEKAS